MKKEGIEKEKLKEILVENIRRLMDHDGWTCYQLQKEHGINARTMYSVLRKEILPNIYIIIRLAEVFEVSVEWMITEHKTYG